MLFHFSKNSFKVAAAFSGIAGYLLLSDEKKLSYALSTNTPPSIPWDWNWDKYVLCNGKLYVTILQSLTVLKAKYRYSFHLKIFIYFE